MFSNFQLKENIFTYLLAHSISNAFYTFITFFCWISRSGTLFSLSDTYFSKFYDIYIFHVGIYGFGTFTAFIDIAISLDRLFLIKKVKFIDKKITIKFSLILMLILSIFISSVYIIIRTIKQDTHYKTTMNSTIISYTYSIVLNEFGTSFQGILIYIIVTALKNCLTIIVMIIVNTLLFVEIKKFYSRKNALLKSKIMQNVWKKIKNEESYNSQNKFRKMTLAMSVIYLACNITNAVILLSVIFYYNKIFVKYVVAFADFPQFLSYGLNIFLYYNYNSRYKKIIIDYLKRMRIIK